MQPLLTSIDWQRPWLKPLLPIAKPIVASGDWKAALNEAARANAIVNHRGLPIRFVPQSELPQHTAYEKYISESGHVPTRDNLHDFFNGLIWLAYPLAKRRLNALQASEIERQHASATAGNTNRRGAKRDAATLLDENAAIVVVHRNQEGQSVAEHLRQHHWLDAFLIGRKSFNQNCSVLLFGHALIEKLVAPYKAITAHALLIHADDSFFSLDACVQLAWADASLALLMQSEALASSLFTPLPVLGVPDWCENQDWSFYQDTKVFRPKRSDHG